MAGFTGKKFRKGTKVPTKKYARYKAKLAAKANENAVSTLRKYALADTVACATTGLALEDQALQLITSENLAPTLPGQAAYGLDEILTRLDGSGGTTDELVDAATQNVRTHITDSLAQAKAAVRDKNPTAALRVVRANKVVAVVGAEAVIGKKKLAGISRRLTRFPVIGWAIKKIAKQTPIDPKEVM